MTDRPSRSRAPVVALLGLAAIVAFVWWLAGRSTTPERPPAQTPRLATATPTATTSHPRTTPTVQSHSLVPPPPAEIQKDDEAQLGALEGRVVSWTTGAPVPDAELTFMHDGVATSTRSDGEGVFVFVPHHAGRHELAAATARGFLPYAPALGQSPIVFFARPRERITGAVLVLTPALTYTGVVLDPEGEPVAGAEVTLLDSPAHEQELIELPSRFESDARGEFEFHAPDWALFEARHPDFAPGRARLDTSVQISHRLVLRLSPPTEQLEPSYSIVGTVSLPDDSPASEAFVVARSPHREIRRSAHDSAGPDGRFVLEPLDAGEYDVTASLAGYATTLVEGVPAGSKDVALQLSAGVGIEGTVTLAGDGAFVAAYTVWVGEQIGPMRFTERVSEAVYDSQGTFYARGLGPGTYLILVSAQGYAPARVADVVIADGQTEPTKVEIPLLRGGALSGKVIEKGTGTPLEGARVTVESGAAPGPSAVPGLASATTDQNGEFMLRALAPGSTSVSVAAADHHARIRGDIIIETGILAGPITIELTPLEEGEEPKLELAGIGAALTPQGDALLITQIIEGGGAAEAGLSEGDEIHAVDGEAVVDLGFQGSIQKIRGPQGTVVVLLVRKAGAESAAPIAVTRRKIRA